MSDYKKLSDFEINRKVFKILHGINPLPYPHDADKRSCGCKTVYGEYHWYDYCNNVNDAWPLIVNNRISLCIDSSEYVAKTIDGYLGKVEINNHWAVDKNPLRAAMIIFLQIKDSQKSAIKELTNLSQDLGLY